MCLVRPSSLRATVEDNAQLLLIPPVPETYPITLPLRPRSETSSASGLQLNTVTTCNQTDQGMNDPPASPSVSYLHYCLRYLETKQTLSQFDLNVNSM